VKEEEMAQKPVIVWTKTDEAPMLATYSLLPIIKSFVKHAGVEVETRDISLAGRVLAQFGYARDDLAYLGELVQKPEANIMKLPNISASVPQLIETVKELQSQGFDLPDFPENPQSEEEKEARAKYDRCIGSVVNPVIRQGNSDRRIAPPVKEYAKKHPHKMGEVSPDSQSYVAHMKSGDFYEHEKSVTIEEDTTIRYEFVDNQGNVTLLKEVKVGKGDVVDGTYMSRRKLREFFKEAIDDAKEKNILFSLHVKATMMKVSDPVIFGDAIRVYYKKLFDRHAKELEEIGFDPNKGLIDLENKLSKLPPEKQEEIRKTVEEIYQEQPGLYMVDSDRGITNLHRPNDVIIDNSIPSVIKNGLKAWGPDGNTYDCVITVPDRSYATMYSEIVEDVKVRGQFDPRKVGTLQNVGLMAMKAEEYGSHDKTFLPPDDGTIRIVDGNGKVLMEHRVEKGDIYRSCITKDIAIRDWIKLAVNRAKETGYPIVFWLDSFRAHDKELIKKIREELPKYDLSDVEWYIKAPREAMKFTLERFRKGLNTIAVTGNVLRDYLTDLFPIIEVGTSARALSIVPLIAGGGLFETGAGGSAPRHVQQFVKEGHLRWDSLGEFLAFVEALKHAYKQSGSKNKKILVVADALSRAVSRYLEDDRTPGRKVGQTDTRGSHYWLARYWAEELARQEEDPELAQIFKPVAQALAENEERILSEIRATEGSPKDLGGYYHPDEAKLKELMRPSKTMNQIIDNL
jgi:isocitrate dehydrogenase